MRLSQTAAAAAKLEVLTAPPHSPYMIIVLHDCSCLNPCSDAPVVLTTGRCTIMRNMPIAAAAKYPPEMYLEHQVFTINHIVLDAEADCLIEITKSLIT